jgi:flagella basal body P-ring formation protein FlgA
VIAILAFAMLQNASDCVPVTSDWIVAADVAKLEPAFKQLPPQTPVAAAPPLGQTRTFQPADLKRFAATHGMDLGFAESLCFTLPARTPSENFILAAMRAEFGNRDVEITVLEQSKLPLPPGDLKFPLSGLSTSGDKPAIWRGYVQFGLNRRFYTWARVRITVHEKRILAKSDIRPGEPLRPDQIEIQGYEGPLTNGRALSDPTAVLGKIARHSIAAGTALLENMIENPPAVTRGESISVIAASGPAVVQSQGFAEETAREGQVIPVKNPQSGKVYRARVQRDGVAVVVPGGFFGIVPGDKKP